MTTGNESLHLIRNNDETEVVKFKLYQDAHIKERTQMRVFDNNELRRISGPKRDE
jgi:hypothetical protein